MSLPATPGQRAKLTKKLPLRLTTVRVMSGWLWTAISQVWPRVELSVIVF